MRKYVIIGAIALALLLVGGAEARPSQADTLTQTGELWNDTNCNHCIPNNGEINLDESYFFGANGNNGTLAFPPVLPCGAPSGCHSGFFFQYGVILRTRGNKTVTPTLDVPGSISAQVIYDFTVKRGGETIRCIDWTFDPPAGGTVPTLTLSGTANPITTGVLRYRFPQNDDWCLAYL